MKFINDGIIEVDVQLHKILDGCNQILYKLIIDNIYVEGFCPSKKVCYGNSISYTIITNDEMPADIVIECGNYETTIGRIGYDNAVMIGEYLSAIVDMD